MNRRASVAGKPGLAAVLKPRDLPAMLAGGNKGVTVISARDFREAALKRAAAPPSARALGRLAPGQLNKTEARFDAHLWRQQAVGAVLWHRAQCLSLKLADGCWFRTDFVILPADHVLTIVDVKGAKPMIEEDAKVKMKVAASIFPFRFAYAFPKSRAQECDWTLEYIE